MKQPEYPSQQPPDLEEHLCLAIYSASITIQRLYKPLLDGMGITFPQYLVLNVLWAQAPLTVGGIAERLDLESSTLTPLLKRLEAAGLVQRTRNPENERQVLVGLTDAGQALRNRAGCVAQTLLDNAGMPPGAISQLNQQVRALNHSIKQQRSGAGDESAD